MIHELKILISPKIDPYENLAIENFLLMHVQENEKILFFYKNQPCVVMGRFQNPWAEINLALAKSRHLKIVRRQSGGGCVYHDLENLNFSFIEGRREFDKKFNNHCITEALKTFNIYSYESNRSDLLVDQNGEKKFSGSAFKQKKDRSFHHGTLLINANLDALSGVLRSPLHISGSKSIPSNRSDVINLNKINSSLDQDKLIESILIEFENHLKLNHTLLKYNERFLDQNYLEQIKDKVWIYGETPKFNLSLGDYMLEVHKGVIKKCSLGDERLGEFEGLRIFEGHELRDLRTYHQNLLNDMYKASVIID